MYKNKFDKCFNNSQKVFSTVNNRNSDSDESFIRGKKYDNVSIEKKIDDIFRADDYVYKADVKIITDNAVMDKRIVARNRNNLITMEGEYIPISIIRDIYK